LGHQMRRAAVSCLAEGLGNRSQAEKARFLNIVEGSLEECRYHRSSPETWGHGQTRSLTEMLEEASRLPNPCARAILASRS
jgi:four helix bundle protein